MTASSEYSIGWLGYNEKPNYNRIWGWLEMNDGRRYVFFGIKGKKIEFKPHRDMTMIRFLVHQMENKGFEKIKIEHYEIIHPNFIQEFETWFTSAILADNFR